MAAPAVHAVLKQQVNLWTGNMLNNYKNASYENTAFINMAFCIIMHSSFEITGMTDSHKNITMKVKAQSIDNIVCADTIFMARVMNGIKYVDYKTDYYIIIRTLNYIDDSAINKSIALISHTR